MKYVTCKAYCFIWCLTACYRLCFFSSRQYGYEGRVPMRSARLFYDTSERARQIIESYFQLNSTLHFSYTHLVCRTAITGNSNMLPLRWHDTDSGWHVLISSWLHNHRSARPQEWPEPSHPRWQLSAGPWSQWVLEGTTSIHIQRLQVWELDCKNT